MDAHMRETRPSSSPATVPVSESVRFEVPFHDIDMLEVVWHGHYYKYFEYGRTVLFRKVGLDVPQLRELGYSMVVSESHCRYLSPLAYGMPVTCRASVVEWEFRLKISYELFQEGRDKPLAKGYTIQVALEGVGGKLLMVMPEALASRFAPQAPAQENTHDT